METKENNLDELKKAAEPLIKYLCDNYHPSHVIAIVTSTGVEILEGVASIQNIVEFINE